MKAINQILSWVQEFWGALTILGTLFGGFVSFLHFNIVMPEIDKHIDGRVYKVAEDSLAIWTEHYILNRHEGFEGRVQDATLIPRNLVADTVAGLILGEDEIRKAVKEHNKSITYLMGWSIMVLKQIAEPIDYNGVPLWRTYYGDVMYLDDLGMVWDAHYLASDDRYYYYPTYSNGQRLRCFKY